MTLDGPSYFFVMAGVDQAIQRNEESFAAWTRGDWMAASRAAMTIKGS
jgi:hypothetical protein